MVLLGGRPMLNQDDRIGGSMALDGSILGTCASEQMEALERAYHDDDTAEIVAVMTIVEIVKRTGEDSYSTNVRMRHNLGDPYRAIGILRAAEQNLLKSFEGD